MAEQRMRATFKSESIAYGSDGANFVRQNYLLPTSPSQHLFGTERTSLLAAWHSSSRVDESVVNNRYDQGERQQDQRR
jgi:hypothetical protein